jgi:protein arginine kinase
MMGMTWYQDPRTDAGPIISARVRLARNVKKYPFRAKLSDAQAREMIAEASDVLMSESGLKFINPHEYSEIERRMFIEKHIISREFVNSDVPRGLMIKDDLNASIMMNEEDHIRIQA